MPVRIGELTTPSFGAAVTIVDAAQLQPDCWAIAEPPNKNAKLATDNTANEIDFDIFRVPFWIWIGRRNPPGIARTEPEIDLQRGLQVCKERPTFLTGAGLELKASLQHLKMMQKRNLYSSNCVRSSKRPFEQVAKWLHNCIRELQ